MSVSHREDSPSRSSSFHRDGKFGAEREDSSGMETSGAAAKSNSGDDEVATREPSRRGGDRDSSSSSYRSSGRRQVDESLCRDFIFFTCHRKGCKFRHPEPDSREYKEAKATRAHRDRSRSPRDGGSERSAERSNDRSGGGGGGGGSSSNDKDPTDVCRDFMRDMCQRGKKCHFYHPPQSDDDLPWPQLCIDYRKASCSRVECRYFHYGNDDEEYYLRTWTVGKKLLQQFVSITLKDSSMLRNRPVCKDFLQTGECTMKVCRYRHTTQIDYETELYDILVRMVWEKCRKKYPTMMNNAPGMSSGGMGGGSMGGGGMGGGGGGGGGVMSGGGMGGSGGYGMQSIPQGDMQQHQMNSSMSDREVNPYGMSTMSPYSYSAPGQLMGSNTAWGMTGRRDYASGGQAVAGQITMLTDENMKLKRNIEVLEAKVRAKTITKEEVTIANEKKQYLEMKLKQYYEGMKRCETEFITTLEKNFNINNPQIMSYFPSWGSLMSFVTEMVTQINNDDPLHDNGGGHIAPLQHNYN